jgi:hypothetical protein
MFYHHRITDLTRSLNTRTKRTPVALLAMPFGSLLLAAFTMAPKIDQIESRGLLLVCAALALATISLTYTFLVAPRGVREPVPILVQRGNECSKY